MANDIPTPPAAKPFKKNLPLIVFAAVVIGIIYLISLSGAQVQNNFIISVPFIVAFLGGVLSLMSPCSAALVPAFFAYSFKQKTHLVRMTFIFWLGLALVFVPLGFSASVVSQLFINNRRLLFWVAGIIFFIFGYMVLTGKSWQILPARWRQTQFNKHTPLGVFLMGVLFALASGTCTAPILGTIVTLAATIGGASQAILLLLVYSFGLVVPLFILAWFFDRGNFSQTKLIRGQEIHFNLGPKTLTVHSTNLITALIFFALGIIFIATNGTNGLLNFYDQGQLTDIYFDLNKKILDFFNR